MCNFKKNELYKYEISPYNMRGVFIILVESTSKIVVAWWDNKNNNIGIEIDKPENFRGLSF